MAADLSLLNPAFKAKVDQLLTNCLNRGVEMRPSETLRDPFKQARLWRQSRTIEQITKEIQFLKEQNALFLAECLERVGPQSGKHATNAIPGLSWHQWSEAVDSFWVVDSQAEYSLKRVVKGQNGYKVYAEEAKSLGLEAGFFWKKFQDSGHIQLRVESNPSAFFTLQEIDHKMQNMFPAQ